MNGWTRETSNEEKARNLAQPIIEKFGKRVAGKIIGDLIVKHDGITAEMLREMEVQSRLAIANFPTSEQIALDEWQRDTRQTLESVRP